MNPNMLEENTSCSDHETATAVTTDDDSVLARSGSHAERVATASIVAEFELPTAEEVASTRNVIEEVVSNKDPRATWGIVKLLQQDGSGATQDTSGTWSTTSDHQLVLVNDELVVDDDCQEEEEESDYVEHYDDDDFDKDGEEGVDNYFREQKHVEVGTVSDVLAEGVNEREGAILVEHAVAHEGTEANQAEEYSGFAEQRINVAEDENEGAEHAEVKDEEPEPEEKEARLAEVESEEAGRVGDGGFSPWNNNQDYNKHQRRQITLEEIMEEEEKEKRRRSRQEEITAAALANNSVSDQQDDSIHVEEKDDEDERMLRYALEMSLREFNSSQSALGVTDTQLDAEELLASLLEDDDDQQQQPSPRSPPFQREVEVTEKIIGTPHSEQRTMPKASTIVQSIPRLPLHRADSNPTSSNTTTMESTSSTGASVATNSSTAAVATSQQQLLPQSLQRRDVEKTETIIETPHDDRRRRRSSATTAWNGSRRSLLAGSSGSWKSQRLGNASWSESTQQQQQQPVPSQQQQQVQQLPSTPQPLLQLQPPTAPTTSSNDASHVCDLTLLEAARKHLTPKEVEEIEKALREADTTYSVCSSTLQDSNRSSLAANSEHSQSSQNQHPLLPSTPLHNSQSSFAGGSSSLATYSLSSALAVSAIVSPSSELEQHLLSEEEVLLMASASHHLSAEDAVAIQRALQEVEQQQRLLHEQQHEQLLLQQLQSEPLQEQSYYGLQAPVTAEEEAAIQRALKEADEEEESKSLQLAILIHEEETRQQQNQHQQQAPRVMGNVRTMTRAELAAEQNPPPATSSSPGVRPPHAVGAFYSSSPPRRRHPLEEEEEQRRQHQQSSPSSGQRQQQQQQRRLFDEMLNATAGFRINSNSSSHQQQQQQWARIDRSSIVGPNREIRTKHDTELQGQANAQRLGLDMFDDEATMRTLVGNQAYNSFLQSTKQRNMIKGVASHGTGRANSDSDATKGGAMDARVRLQISRAINNGLIERCNGVVKEGKEAVIYHADHGTESGGYDVAVKVFKRIQEFRSRVDYAEGDPRYTQKSSFRHASSDPSAFDLSAPVRGGDARFTRKASFRNASDREQLELWAEKEYRNLIRANRAGVPVPTPLLHKENVLYMRFLGTDGWPSPQLRELNLKNGSTKWHALYRQIMKAVRRLYHGAQLIHGDLSEYNIMVVPAHLVENKDSSIEDEQIEVQAVLIDFGQAVVKQHPESASLLRRDLEMVRSFFIRQGIQVMDENQALAFVLDPDRMLDDSRRSEEVSETATG